MKARAGDVSPQGLARLGGALYLGIIALGLYAEVFVRGRLIAPGDAAATAARIVAAEPLWRSGIVAELLSGFATTGLAMVYFVLLRPVSRPLNLLATFFRLIAIAVQMGAVLFLVVAFLPLGRGAAFMALAPEVRQALASLAIQTHSRGYGIALAFTGCTFLVHGWLVYRSGFLPRVLGVLIQIAGVCYLTSSLAAAGAPAVARLLDPYWMLPPFVAEVSLSLWLLVKGVDVGKWWALADAQRARESA